MNSPHKVAGGSLVQVQLNFAAVVETHVSSGPQENTSVGTETNRTTKQKQVTALPYQAIHCPKIEITMLHGSNTFLSPDPVYRSDILAATLDTVQRHLSRSEGKRNNCQVSERVRNTGNRVSRE